MLPSLANTYTYNLYYYLGIYLSTEVETYSIPAALQCDHDSIYCMDASFQHDSCTIHNTPCDVYLR